MNLKNLKIGNGNLKELAVTFFVFFLFFLLSMYNIGRSISDEELFHFPNVLNISDHGIKSIFNSEYSAANTPLPYILIALIGKLFSPSIFLSRIVTCLISILAFLCLAKFLRRYKVKWWYAAIILFYPYFLVNSFVFYVMNFGVFFMVSALLFVNENEKLNPLNNLYFGLLATCAVLCQQFYIVIPIALVFSLFLYYLKSASHSRKENKKFLLSIFLILAPLALPIALFLRWGGITHPNFKTHTVSFHPANLIAILAVIGFYAFPFLMQFYWSISRSLLILLIILIFPIAWIFMPGFNDTQGSDLFTGIVFHVLFLTARSWSIFPLILVLLFVWFGSLVVFRLITTSPSFTDRFLLISCISFALVYAFNTLIGERHILPLIILLFLLVIPRLKRGFVFPYFVWMLFMGISYFIYWNYFKLGLIN